MRREVLARDQHREMIFSMVEEMAAVVAQDFFPNGRLRKDGGVSHLDMKELNDAVTTLFAIPAKLSESDIKPFNDVGLKNLLVNTATAAYQIKKEQMGEEVLGQLEKMILLTTIDGLWKDHLLGMDHLREGIGLQGYGQKDPLIQYKKEGFRYFQMMMDQITADVIRKVFAVQLAQETDYRSDFEEALSSDFQYNLTEDGGLLPLPGGGAPGADLQGAKPARLQPPPVQQPKPSFDFTDLMRAQQGPMTLSSGVGPARPVQNEGPKVGRNDPCPCGSGKKYKKCHGTGA